MKRIFLIILLSTIQALSLFAEHIAPSTAMTEAEQFFYAKTKVGDGKLEMVYQSNELYIINNLHTGFVIIAADDRARKILAYSYDNIFTIEGAPENLQAWLNDTEYQIRLAVNNNLPKYSEPDRAKSMSPILLETALWDQKYPFNLMCPKYRTGGEYCTTGCTNTATAILMRYHKWPKAGVGELPGYEYSVNGHYYQKGHLLGHIYDWDCMPVAPQKSYTKYQEQQLSQIMFDIGVMNEAHWNPYHSETALENITRLSKYFGYDKSIEYSIRLMYSDSEWKKMIIDALHTFGPVIYSGGNPDGNGHAYIIDGHDGNEYFHINFGWSGSSNGYYSLSSTSQQWFPLRNTMICNLRPDQGGTVQNRFVLLDNPRVDEVSIGVPFKVSISQLCSTSYEREADFCMALIDINGKYIKSISNSQRIKADLYYRENHSHTFSCLIDEIPANAYRIGLCYMEGDTGHLVKGKGEEIYTVRFGESLDKAVHILYCNYSVNLNTEQGLKCTIFDKESNNFLNEFPGGTSFSLPFDGKSYTLVFRSLCEERKLVLRFPQKYSL